MFSFDLHNYPEFGRDDHLCSVMSKWASQRMGAGRSPQEQTVVVLGLLRLFLSSISVLYLPTVITLLKNNQICIYTGKVDK